METIRQGETFSFDLEVSGDESLSCTMSVLQYPGDTAAITKIITPVAGVYSGLITSAESALLDVGQWMIVNRFTDSDEDVREPIKLYVSKGWV